MEWLVREDNYDIFESCQKREDHIEQNFCFTTFGKNASHSLQIAIRSTFNNAANILPNDLVVLGEYLEKNGQAEDELSEKCKKIVHEKYGELVTLSKSNLSDLISIHYLKTMWSLGIDTEPIFDEFVRNLENLDNENHFDVLFNIIQQENLPSAIKNKIIMLLILMLNCSKTRVCKLMNILLKDHEEEHTVECVPTLRKLFINTFRDEKIYMVNEFIIVLFEIADDIDITYIQIAAVLSTYFELLCEEAIDKQHVLCISSSGTASSLDWEAGGLSNGELLAVREIDGEIYWYDSIGCIGFMHGDYVEKSHYFKKFTDKLDWVKIVGSNNDKNKYIYKSGNEVGFFNGKFYHTLEINAKKIVSVHHNNRMVLFELKNDIYVYFYHDQNGQNVELYNLGERVKKILGDKVLKEFMLFHDERSSCSRLLSGFGAILTVDGAVFEFNNFFTDLQHAWLVNGIEHIYADPESHRYYFLQSFGGCLYDIPTSEDLFGIVSDRLSNLSQTEILYHHCNGNTESDIYVPMSNKLIKKMAFDPSEGCGDEHRISIITRGNRLMRCSLLHRDDETFESDCIVLRHSWHSEVLPINDFQLFHCLFASYFVTTSSNVEPDIKEQVSILKRVFENLSKHRNDGRYSDEADLIIYSICRRFNSAGSGLKQVTTEDLFTFVGYFWRLESENKEPNNKISLCLLTLWTELNQRDVNIFPTIIQFISEQECKTEKESVQKILCHLLNIMFEQVKPQFQYNLTSMSTEDLNVVCFFILITARGQMPEKVTKLSADELNTTAKLIGHLLNSLAEILNHISVHANVDEELFQSVTDVFCHYVDIIENKVLASAELPYCSFYIMANFIHRTFIANEQLNRLLSAIGLFFTSIVARKTNSALLIVLFTELIEAAQKLLTVLGQLYTMLDEHENCKKLYRINSKVIFNEEQPIFVLRSEVDDVIYALRIGDFAIDISDIEDPKRQSLLDQYQDSSPNFINQDDKELIDQQPRYIVIPDIMHKIVHCQNSIATFFGSVKANLLRSLELLCTFNGKMRCLTETALSNLSLPPKKYQFVHHLVPVEDLSDDAKELLKKTNTYLAPYEGQSRPILILLGKCAEAFIILNNYANTAHSLPQILSKIFMKIMKRHQESVAKERSDMVNLCLEPLRKAEFLCRQQLKSKVTKWRKVMNPESLNEVIRLRIETKKKNNLSSQVINFLLDDEVKYKEVENFLELKEIFGSILSRSSRIPIGFKSLPIAGKTCFLHGWLSFENTFQNADDLKLIYHSHHFTDLKNRRIAEVEHISQEIIYYVRKHKGLIFDEMNVEHTYLITLLINAINHNIKYFSYRSIPYYVTNTLQVMLLEIGDNSYFDPLYSYIVNEVKMHEDFSSFQIHENTDFCLGQKVITLEDYQTTRNRSSEKYQGTIIAMDEEEITVRWNSDDANGEPRMTYHTISLEMDIVITSDEQIDREKDSKTFRRYKNNPLQVFVAFIIDILSRQNLPACRDALVPIVLQLFNNAKNYSILPLLDARVVDNIFEDIFTDIREVMSKKELTNYEIVASLQWFRLCVKTQDRDNILKIYKLLGRLVSSHISYRVEKNENALSLALTFISQIIRSIREELNMRSVAYFSSFRAVMREIIAKKGSSLNEIQIGVLMVLCGIDTKYLIGEKVEILVSGSMKLVEIVWIKSTSLIGISVNGDDIEVIQASTTNIKAHDKIGIFDLKEPKMKILCADFILRIFDDVSAMPRGLQLKNKTDILDKYLSYVITRIKIQLLKSGVNIVDRMAEMTAREIQALVAKSAETCAIRHTFDREALLDYWEKKLLVEDQKEYDNNSTSFSAALFATSLSQVSKEQTSSVPPELENLMVEMGFGLHMVRYAHRQLSREHSPESINNEMMVEKILDLSNKMHDFIFSDEESNSEEDDVLKRRMDFDDMPFDYPAYVLKNVKLGTVVKLLKNVDFQIRNIKTSIRANTTGKVVELASASDIFEKSIHVMFGPRKCWVKPSDIELIAHLEENRFYNSQQVLRIGQSVKISDCVAEPYYKMGKVTHQCVGVIKDINKRDVIVDFPNHVGWHGRLDELERAFSVPNRIVTDCDKIVEECQASSNVEDTINLFDRKSETCWKSSRIDQSDDHIWLNFKIRKNMIISYIKLRVDQEDQSFMPSQISVCGHEGHENVQTLKTVNIREDSSYSRAILLLGKQKTYFKYISLKINSMLLRGQDCKIRAIEMRADLPPLQIKSYSYSLTPKYDCTEKTRVFVWGLNDSDQILSDSGCVFEPSLSHQMSTLHVKDICMTSKGTIILSNDGSVNLIGDVPPRPASAGTSKLRELRSCLFVKISAHCTGKHWIALDKFDQVWSCDSTNDEPVLVEELSSIVDISAGYNYSLAVDIHGKVYGWGSNRNYRIISTQEEQELHKPMQIKINAFIVTVCAGSSSGASFALDDMGILYGWGTTTDFQLGFKDDDIHDPLQIPLNQDITQVSSGADFNAALDSDGNIWTWGRKKSGRLGNSDHAGPPEKVKTESIVSFIIVKCGALHAIAVDTAGSIWTWGDNSHGQLGQEQTFIKTPQFIKKTKNDVVGIACGSGHACYWIHSFVRRKLSFMHSKGEHVGEFGLHKQLLQSVDEMYDFSRNSVERLNRFDFDELEIRRAFNSYITNQILYKFVVHNINQENASYANIAYDFAKKIYFKRVKSDGRLYQLLRYFTLQNSKIFWNMFSQFCSLVGNGVMPVSKCEFDPTIKSDHPYKLNQYIPYYWISPGASSITLEFNANCHLEHNCDYISLKAFDGFVYTDLTGKFGQRSSLNLPINYLRLTFESDLKNSFWGYDVKLRNEYDYDLGIRLDDNEIINMPNLGYLINLYSDEYLHGLEITEVQYLTRKLLLCLMKCSSLSIYESLWLFKLANKLLKIKYTSVPTFESKVINLLLELMRIEDIDVQEGHRLHYSPTVHVLLQTLRLFPRNQMQEVLRMAPEHASAKLVRFFDVCDTADYLQGKSKHISTEFFAHVRRRVSGLYGVDINHNDSVPFSTTADMQLNEWLNAYPDSWHKIDSVKYDTRVFGWGNNNRSQLGGIIASEDDCVRRPTEAIALNALNPSQIMLGDKCMFVIAEHNIWSCGDMSHGRLGHPTPDTSGEATLNEMIKIENIPLISTLSIHPVGRHVLAITLSGALMSWGDSEFGQTGHYTRENIEKPRLVASLQGVEVIKVSAGRCHSACITRDGELYTWGGGRDGILGHPIATGVSHRLLSRPKKVESFRHLNVVDVACGSLDGHTLALTVGDSGSIVWSWGNPNDGKLGRSFTADFPSHLPGLVKFDTGVRIDRVFCGPSFSLVKTIDGDIYTWGKGQYYRLGHGTEDTVDSPKRVQNIEKVKEVAVGALHFLCVTHSGKLIGWGDNDKGQLGLTCDRVKLPTQIMDSELEFMIAAGSSHSVAWMMKKGPGSVWRVPDKIPKQFAALESVDNKQICIRRMFLAEFSNALVNQYQMLDLSNFSLEYLVNMVPKENLLRRLITQSMVRDRQHGPTIQINRVIKQPSNPNDPMWMGSVTWQIINEVLTDSNDYAFKLNGRCWKIRFIGESVDDCGGGYSDSIAEICEELQDSNLGIPILLPTPNTAEFQENNSKEYIFRPVANNEKMGKNLHLLFEFFGILIGAAIRQGSPLSLQIEKSMWKLIQGKNLEVSDIYQIDDGIRHKFEFLAGNENVDDVEIEGTVTSLTGEKITIIDGNVTAKNKSKYLKMATEYKLNEFGKVAEVIRGGIVKVVPLTLLALFTPKELEKLITGEVEIPIALLKKVTVYKGVTADSDYAKWFWEVLAEFSRDERQLFLRFVWGRTRLPRSVGDFRGRDFVLQVMDKYKPADEYLPEAYTCFFLLKMPRYTTKTILKEKLSYAINFCKSIDIDEYAHVNLNEEDRTQNMELIDEQEVIIIEQF